MNVSPQTFILFSLGIDLLLCLVLVFMWWRHNDEQHALAWAGGQLALTAGTLVWFLGSPEWPRQALAAVTLTASVAGFWAGTEIFLGNFKQKHRRPAVLGFVLAGCTVYLLWRNMPQLILPATAAIYGLTFLWIGYRLASNRNHYRLLGLVLVVRGIFNLCNSLGVVPTVFELWFIFSFLVKSASMLCLIHAVQEKIQKRYTRAIDSLTKGFVVYDSEGIIRSANLRCARLLGCPSVEKLVGTHAADWNPAVTREMVAGHFSRFAAAKRYPYVETMVFSNYEGELPVELIASPHYERSKLHCMMLVMDITERKKKDDELLRAAHYDSITGLLNRHGLSLQLAALLARAEASGVATSGAEASGVATSGVATSGKQEGAVLFIDLDKFKRVNDSFGHAVGDQLLCQIAGLLQSALGPHDLLARFGGDEFIVVLPAASYSTSGGVALKQAAVLGERILRTLGNGFQLSPQHITVSASIGVACYPTDGSDAETLIRNAEIAMHDVKTSGRGTLRSFNSAMSAYAREALVIDGALRSAIHAGELRLVYQPITNAASGRLDKVEALLRWHSATLGVIGPDRFIPVAEDSGLIIELGAWVLDNACRQLAAWDDSLPVLAVSINVSARQLLDPGFTKMVEQALAHHRLAPQRLELELTERVLIGDGEQVRGVLAHLRELGVSISLDDFGTGYSSLSYLTHFQINTLKIDRAFVTDMVHNPRSRALVGTIIAMGHSLGLQLVAEGVETADQAQALQAMGCHYLQGYHISRPLDAAALPQFAVKT